MTVGGSGFGNTVTRDAPDLAAILSQSLQLLGARRGADALALIARAPASIRGDPRVAAQIAYAESLMGRMAEAMAAARAAMAAPALDLVSLDLVGNSFTLCQQPEDAYAAFQRAVALAPGNPAVLFNLATTARFLGRSEEAEAAYDRVIAAAPNAWEAYRNRSELRRQTPDRNHVAELARVLEQARPPWQGEVQLCYALGKEYEDLAAYDEAFAHFDRGARVRRSHMRYDVADDVEAMRLIEEAFDAAWCAPGREMAAGDGPIFILGLPRTGSTLLEQMLGRHSSVQPLGELQAFGAAMTGVLRRRTPGLQPGKAAMIRASAHLPPAEIGAAYLAAVAPLRDGRPQFIDKLPFNVLYAGLIARALPSARIVHLTRDPLDACFAIYKTLFDEAYPYAYDLAELGAYHNAYHRLTAHWRSALGPRFIEIGYEALVADPSGALTPLMDQLGLSMEPACLNQGRGGAAVMTASASQVREPIHARSVDSASRYRAHLGALVDALARYGGPV
jgi:tetratricopeptide (TPR) repeat protein